MSRLTRGGTAEPVSRDQILRHARGQGNINFSCSADHEQDWQPDLVDPYSATCDDHTYIHIEPLWTEFPLYSKKSLNASRPSGHPLVREYIRVPYRMVKLPSKAYMRPSSVKS